MVGEACVGPNLQQQADMLMAEQAFLQRQMCQAVAGSSVVAVLHLALRARLVAQEHPLPNAGGPIWCRLVC